MIGILIDDVRYQAETGERLVDVLNRIGVELSQVCYHPQLGPIQICDTCLVEVNGGLVRACATAVADGMAVSTVAPGAQAERNQAFDSILIVHNTTKILEIDEQTLPFKAKLYEVDNTNPFFRYDRDQCILCGRCVEACQNLQVKETLSICWEDPPSRALGRRSTIYESSCVSCAGRTQLGMLELFRRMRTDNSRRGLAVAIDVLEAVGKAV